MDNLVIDGKITFKVDLTESGGKGEWNRLVSTGKLFATSVVDLQFP